MGERIYGYVRVSTQEQNEARHLTAMRDFGVQEKNIVVEKVSGKDFDRPRYRRLVRALRAKDVLVVKSIDCLGRNCTEILDQWSFITKKQEAVIAAPDMPLLDTRQSRDLTGTLISDIVLQLLNYVAQTERENIRQRQIKGQGRPFWTGGPGSAGGLCDAPSGVEGKTNDASRSCGGQRNTQIHLL